MTKQTAEEIHEALIHFQRLAEGCPETQALGGIASIVHAALHCGEDCVNAMSAMCSDWAVRYANEQRRKHGFDFRIMAFTPEQLEQWANHNALIERLKTDGVPPPRDSDPGGNAPPQG